jgi:hypothetical protein
MPPALGYIVSVSCYTSFMERMPPALGYIVSVSCYKAGGILSMNEV